jgi:tRNA(Ile)-lysidine synthase
LPCTVARRAEIEPSVCGLPANLSARFRRLRFALFERVVHQQSLAGVILAHHADDQAETVLHRLLRSSGPMGLVGMSARSQMGSLVVVRPLLPVRREQLQRYLEELNQPWRTDASNESMAYLRNRLRAILSHQPKLVDALLDLAKQCGELREWIRASAPRLDERFAPARLADLPDVLARESARVWLIERGVRVDEIDPSIVERLLRMSRDAASAPSQHFPGGVLIRRRRGQIYREG